MSGFTFDNVNGDIDFNGGAPTLGGASAGGGLVLIETQTVSTAVGSLNFVTGIDSTYDNYIIMFHNVSPATTSTDLLMRVSHDTGSTWASASNAYKYNIDNISNGVSTITADGGSATSATIAKGVTNFDNWYALSGTITVSNPYGGAPMNFYGQSAHNPYTVSVAATFGGSYRYSDSAVDGIQLFFSSGNIDTGTFSIYGVVK